ncbi:protein kinase domain-containing protein [Derxia lacustris]|uniref:protein kinase domain-containing protein n=1 Tax=Derxia lacustris TaxID=764842 RepID=UPI000A173CA1|nr:protein kinase [Derxia lacustris]
MDQRIGKYELIRRIGEGSSSNVWLCRDPFTERLVAVKVAKSETLRDERYSHVYRKLFAVEAHLAGKLHHPHIAMILDAVDEGDLRYIVSEYVPGGTLEQFCRPERLLPQEKVVEIMFKCARALEFAHRIGITHRDVKPANILVNSDNDEVRDVKLTDFGTAMNLAEDSTLVEGIGSPAYMSPEQISEGALSHQTDIYSLGVVMYQLLTGRLPFEAQNNAAMIYQVLHSTPPAPSELRPGVAEHIEAIAVKAMAKDRSQRYPSWDAFAADLARAARAEPRSIRAREVADTERFSLLKSLRFFDRFDEAQLWEVVRFADWQRRGHAQRLYAEGDMGTDFFILAEGQVRVTKHGKLLTALGPGECIGEMGYLAGLDHAEDASHPAAQRSADVVTVMPCTLIRVSPTALAAASEGCQLRFNRAFLSLLAERLQVANQRLTTPG